jgi:hypothetical protein
MQTWGYIPTGGVILFPMMSKGEKEKDQKRNNQVHEVRKLLSREGILSGGVTLFYKKRRGTWRETRGEKHVKRKKKNMNIRGESPRRDTLFH